MEALARIEPSSRFTRIAATEVVPRSTTSPAMGAESLAGNTSSTVTRSSSVSITQRTWKVLSRSTRASFFSAAKQSTIFCAPVISSSFHIRRSLSGMVSSALGASIATVTADRLVLNSMPASTISALVWLKMASSFSEEMSATFMRLR